MEKEFLRSYDEYADMLFRHCYFKVSDRELALDIVQDTFMKVWDAVQKGQKIKNWRAFLFRTLNNRIIDQYRKKKSTSLDALLEKEGVTEGSFDDLQSGGLEDEVRRNEQQEGARELYNALVKLPKQYADAVIMRYIDGLPPREIAEITGESESVVSTRVHRGLQKLGDIMQNK